MNTQYEELSGRIEGLADFVLALTATLEMDSLINGKVLTERIHQSAQLRTIPDRPDCTKAARQMLLGMASQLESMRAARQLKGC